MPGTKESRVCPAINATDFELGNLKPLSHSAEAISNALATYVRRMSSPNTEEWAPRQERALEKQKMLGTWNLGQPTNLDDLTTWFTIFNDAFFGGLLTGYCELEFWDEKSTREFMNKHVAGFAEQRYRLGKPDCRIVVRERFDDESVYLIEDYLNTLLHEMVHVIFLVYQCLSDPEQNNNEGEHHIYWQLASGAIQDVVKVGGQTEFAMGLDLGREKALAADIQEGYLFPADVRLRFLNLDILRILDELRLWRPQLGEDTDMKEPEQSPIRVIPLLDYYESENHNSNHIPERITYFDFLVGNLTPFSHTPEDISDAIVNFISRSTYYCEMEDLTLRQQRALLDFRHHGSWHLGNPHNLDDIRKYFQIFDNAYFNGLLGGYCRLELVESKFARYRVERGFDNGACEIHEPGKERDPRYPLERPQVTITIRKQKTPLDTRTSFVNIRCYIVVLLHEMLHAMFELYTCRCESGYGQRIAHQLNGRHNIPWQIAAFAIDESNMQGRNLFGLGYNFARYRSLAADLQKGSTLPGDAALRSFNLSITWIRDKLRHARQKDAAKAKRERVLMLPIKAGSVCIRDQWSVDNWQREFGYERKGWAEMNPDIVELNEVLEKPEYLR